MKWNALLIGTISICCGSVQAMENSNQSLTPQEIKEYIVHTNLIEDICEEDDVAIARAVLHKLGYTVDNKKDENNLLVKYEEMQAKLSKIKIPDEIRGAADQEIERIIQEVLDESQDFASDLIQEAALMQIWDKLEENHTVV